MALIASPAADLQTGARKQVARIADLFHTGVSKWHLSLIQEPPMHKGSLLFILCSVWACHLAADPIYTYTATGFSGTVFPNQSYLFNASGLSFSINGGELRPIPPIEFQVGDIVPLSFAYLAPVFGTNLGLVDFGGVVLPPVYALNAVVNQTSDASFVLPQNPVGTYTFSAAVAGQYTVFPQCSSAVMSCPPPGTQADILVNLPGSLTVTVSQFGTRGYFVSEMFLSNPVPEPSPIALLTLGLGTAAWGGLARRRRLVR